MEDGVSLISSAQRAVLTSTQTATEIQNSSAQRVATGRRVNQVSDDPIDYTRAQALLAQVGELAEFKGALELDQSSLQTANFALDTIETYSAQLTELALTVQNTDSAAERAALAEQFNDIRAQIDSIARDATFGSSAPLTSFEFGTSDVNDFATQADIDAALNAVSTAVDQIRSRQRDTATSLAVNNIQQDFAEGLSDTLQTGAQQLLEVDLNEEAAVQLAAQVRRDLSFTSQTIVNQSESLLLGIF